MTTPKVDNQHAILQFIYDKQLEKGYPPTVREIAAGVGLSSTSTVHGHLSRLEKKGFLAKDPTKTRALEVTEAGMLELGINQTNTVLPVMDESISFDEFGEVQSQTIDYFPIPGELTQFEGDLFMTRLHDSAMINIGMLDGDQVIVKKQTTAMNGEIVAVLNDGKMIVRRIFREADHFRMQPENDNFRPEIVKEVKILGRVVGLYRDSIY